MRNRRRSNGSGRPARNDPVVRGRPVGALKTKALVGKLASMAQSNLNLRRFMHESLVDVLA